MRDPPLGPGGEDITWPDQVAPRSRKASSTQNLKPPTSNLPPRPQKTGRGPQLPAQRMGGRGGESAQPRTPITEARVAPPRRPHAAPGRLPQRQTVGGG